MPANSKSPRTRDEGTRKKNSGEGVYGLDSFFELSLDLHVVSSPDGYFKRVSRSVTDVLGWTVEEFLGSPYIDFVHPDDQNATRREVEKQIRNGEKVLHFENRYRHKDGSWRVLAWKSMPADGLMYATARDVTDFKRIQQEMLESREAAEAASRELEAFSYSVAHDLRTPLRSVDGFSQALLEDYADKLDADGCRYLNLVRDSAQHMGRLIDNILELSRVSRSSFAADEVDLTALAHTAVSRLLRSNPSRRPRVAIEEGLNAHGDACLLAVVLDNLFGNAWKYSSSAAEPEIKFGAETRDGRSEYFVRDNGVGFDMAYVEKLFRPFERLHGTEEFEGTGIGLAIVQRAINRHGGKVRAEGRPGEGATFYFTLADEDQPHERQ